MVKERREQKRFDEMHALGQQNVETLAAARGWCKHLQIELKNYGMLAQMSGLPIGSHDVSCVHAARGIGGMNLPMIVPTFLIENCRGCEAHAPNGDTEWGDKVIAEYEAQEKQAKEETAALESQLEAVRASKRALARDARVPADFTVHRILELTEALFAEAVEERSVASASLREAAKIASDLFPPASIDLLLNTASQPAFADLCLPIVACLAGRRVDLTERLVSVGSQAIDNDLSLENACEILVSCGCGLSRPIPGGVIEKTIHQQNHIRPIGGWPTKDPTCSLVDIAPSYACSTSLLVRAFDENPDSLLTPLRQVLGVNDKYQRINACGVIGEILAQRPAIGDELLNAVIDSLELDDDQFNDSADHEACCVIASIFLRKPGPTDAVLQDRLQRQSREAQSLTASVYQQILRTESSEKTGVTQSQLKEAVALAFQRSMTSVQDQALELDVRQEFANALESGCRHHPDLGMAVFDTLLGALACLCASDDPPAAAPRILLAGQPPPDPCLDALEHQNRQSSWVRFKTSILDCVKDLVETCPSQSGDKLLSCFTSLDSKTHEAFKAKVVVLLGELGHDKHMLPRVLPLLWKALMDYGSVLIRCRGIEAISRCFESAGCVPPSDVVDALLVHLKDTFVMVHQAAIRAIGWNTRWLTPSQAENAIEQLAAWAATYRKTNCFRLEEICRPLLSLTRSAPSMRHNVIRFVAGLLPTDEALVDSSLVDLLVGKVEPGELGSLAVANQVSSWLARSPRDPFDHRDGTRNEAYEWLHSLPESGFKKVRQALMTAAQTVSKREDAWSAARIASVLASFHDYAGEAETLEYAINHLAPGRRNEQVMQTLSELAKAARANGEVASRSRNEGTA